MSDSLLSLVTALADDELVLGHRHSEWTGHAPHIEEDVAFSSIAQDEIGHAAAYYGIVAALDDDDADRLALGRKPHEYRNAILCERPNRDWAYTLARHWLYDAADDVRLEVLERSAHGELAALAVKLRREERYHLLHARTWMERVARGPVEGRARVVDALTDAWGDTLGLFEPFELEEDAVERGWLPVPSSELRARFLERASRALDDLGMPPDVRARGADSAEFVASSSGDLIASDDAPDEGRARAPGVGGRRGEHSEDFEPLWDEMTATYRGDPGATW
ncbi:MAG TPA: 1,2-phenylacetyl-CoA epoxidase subunit PaaC [Actinomycetota bacterium]|nr:1,2-phenylacetyl-CoA epoxidase subunit PaaC [Actinomycetota bacterium]